ncbi:Sm domain-containing protein [Pseudozyma hubeiensis]|nr:Sm domain-containing protein [Pseudozyma hubeiensis]
MGGIIEELSLQAAATIEANFVGRTSIVHIPDGRAFCGTFVCVDSGKNIILANTDETRLTHEGRTTSRHVGMVMIPGEYVVKVEVQQDALVPAHSAPHTSLAQAGWPDDESMYT